MDTIVRIAREIYGWGVEVFLLGSCTNNSKRDGDFDLLVRSTGEKKGILERVRMVTRLKLALGDRKVDVIGDYEDNAVVQKALLHGIRLI
ncbi:nucleotidyltransferase domain-containing protein [Odoribacter splanchnicus]|uniref:Nucleotidyltransferase domain-containing protein n=1 Tax=Odoribacter splanchnicus TaxID=28118 RepID=A0A412TK86_9BACT|nr:nucleotidyltransferase domain-containing protein [Odoribacter splanchnicus]